MATGQTLLDLMEVFDQELQLQAAEPDVVRALKSLNAAQDYFESLAAREREILGDQVSTVSTAASTEATTFPAGVLRIDRLQFIDPATSLPAWNLENIRYTGGHRTNRWFAFNLVSPSNLTGKPRGYWTNGRNIYWDPLPDATYSVRWYGFQSASDITAGGTFAYPDDCMSPFAAFAVALMKVGLGDDTNDLASLASTTIQPVIDGMVRFNRDGAWPLSYRNVHST